MTSMVWDHESVLPTAYVTIKPSGLTEEWAIRNINIDLGSTWEIYRTDGVTPVKLMTISTSIANCDYNCNTDYYLTAKNVGSVLATLGYDGLVMVD